MDAIPGDRRAHVWLDVGGAGCIEHLRRGRGHVLHHRELVVAPRHLDPEYRDPECVHHPGRVDLDAVLEAGERFAEPPEIQIPDRLANRLLVGVAEPWRLPVQPRPPAALETVATDEVLF